MGKKRPTKQKVYTTHDELYNFFDYHNPADFPNLEVIEDDDYSYQPDLLLRQNLLQTFKQSEYNDYPLFSQIPDEDDTLDNFLRKHEHEPLPRFHSIAPLPDDINEKIDRLSRTSKANLLAPAPASCEQDIELLSHACVSEVSFVDESEHILDLHTEESTVVRPLCQATDVYEYVAFERADPILHFVHSGISAVDTSSTTRDTGPNDNPVTSVSSRTVHTDTLVGPALTSQAILGEQSRLGLSLEKSLNKYNNTTLLQNRDVVDEKIRSYLGELGITYLHPVLKGSIPARTENLHQLDVCNIVVERTLGCSSIYNYLYKAENGEEVRLQGAAAA